MRILREAGEPDLSFAEDGSIVRVRFPFRARFARSMTYLVQWSCGSRVVQSEWKPWPSGGDAADVEFSVPTECLGMGGRLRFCLLVGLHECGPALFWCHELAVGPDLTWEHVEECREPALA